MKKDLDWLLPNLKLFHEPFAGRAKVASTADHTIVACLANPCPPLVGLSQASLPLQPLKRTSQLLQQTHQPRTRR